MGWLLDGDAAVAIPDAAILVVDGRFAAVGPHLSVPDPDDCDRVDWPWAGALPGLIDAHVHVTFSASRDVIATLESESDNDLVERGVANAERLLRAGVTTAVDRGARNMTGYAVRDAITSGRALGPRLLVSGRPITRSGGHTHQLGGEADGIDGVRRAVRERAREGADGIKIVAGGGMLTPSRHPSESSYSTQILAAATEEAHLHGLRIAAHAHGVDAIRACVEAGVDSVEHGTMLDGAGRWAFDWPLARLMAERGVVAVPGVADSLDNSHNLISAGVRVIAGTDVGVDGTDFTSELYRELLAFVAIGSTPMEAIRAATSSAADALGLDNGIGRVKVGGVADLLIVGGRPDENILALGSPALVLSAGRRIQPRTPTVPAPAVTLTSAGF